MHSLSVCSHVFLCKMIMDVVLWTRVQVRSSFSFLSHRWLETLLCMDNLIIIPTASHSNAFSALTMMVGRQEGHSACKNWVVRCWHGYLSGARCRLAYMAQLMPLPLTVSCFSKIQTGFTFLLPAHLGSPGQRAVKQVCVCYCYDTGNESVPKIILSDTVKFLS